MWQPWCDNDNFDDDDNDDHYDHEQDNDYDDDVDGDDDVDSGSKEKTVAHLSIRLHNRWGWQP